MPDSNSFLSPYEIIAWLQILEILVWFSLLYWIRYIVCTPNRLNEAILMRTHNILSFYRLSTPHVRSEPMCRHEKYCWLALFPVSRDPLFFFALISHTVDIQWLETGWLVYPAWLELILCPYEPMRILWSNFYIYVLCCYFYFLFLVNDCY